eukprot:16369817-Heterocapsa_arctica.AAC.1
MLRSRARLKERRGVLVSDQSSWVTRFRRMDDTDIVLDVVSVPRPRILKVLRGFSGRSTLAGPMPGLPDTWAMATMASLMEDGLVGIVRSKVLT